MSATLGELAVRFGCELRGDPDKLIQRVATLSGAASDELAFLANPRYLAQLAETRAGAVVLDAASADKSPVAALISANPHATFARIAAVLHPLPRAAPGVDASAVVDASAEIHRDAHVGACAVVGAGARIGARTYVGPHTIVGERAVVGADCRLVARVTLCEGVVLGDRCILHPGAVVGADGFGMAPDRGTWVKVPQLGSVRVGSDVEVGANTTIDRGALEDTVIEDGVKLDNQIQIGHNCHIGAHTAMAACVGISGSVVVGKRCMIGGGAGIVGHVTIGDDVIITGISFVSRSLASGGVYSGGIPAEEARTWRRLVGRFKRLDKLAARRAAHRSDDDE
jgi:UDP-3-O-[3-hydroxymyristoyl] glucosamine N-acyltransferase